MDVGHGQLEAFQLGRMGSYGDLDSSWRCLSEPNCASPACDAEGRKAHSNTMQKYRLRVSFLGFWCILLIILFIAYIFIQFHECVCINALATFGAAHTSTIVHIQTNTTRKYTHKIVENTDEIHTKKNHFECVGMCMYMHVSVWQCMHYECMYVFGCMWVHRYQCMHVCSCMSKYFYVSFQRSHFIRGYRWAGVLHWV